MSQILGKLTSKALALTADDLKIYLKQNSFFYNWFKQNHFNCSYMLNILCSF